MLEDTISEDWEAKYHSLTQVFQDLYPGPSSRPLVDGKYCVFITSMVATPVDINFTTVMIRFPTAL